MNFLNPTNSASAGILHRNSVAVAQRGPWSLVSVDYAEDKNDSDTDINGFTSVSFGATCPRGGTCEVCGASIVNIVRFVNAAGEKITTGVDCAETLLRNQDKLKFKSVVSAREKAKRTAAAARRLERNKAAAPALIAKLELDRLATFPGFVGDFSRSIRSQLLQGKVLSLRQDEIAQKLLRENPSV